MKPKCLLTLGSRVGSTCIKSTVTSKAGKPFSRDRHMTCYEKPEDAINQGRVLAYSLSALKELNINEHDDIQTQFANIAHTHKKYGFSLKYTTLDNALQNLLHAESLHSQCGLPYRPIACLGELSTSDNQDVVLLHTAPNSDSLSQPLPKTEASLADTFDWVIEDDKTMGLKEKSKEEAYIAIYKNLMKRLSKMAARWQSAGFTHGSLNSSSISISGSPLHLDQSVFLESLNPDVTPNPNDLSGRFTFKNQIQNIKGMVHRTGTLMQGCFKKKQFGKIMTDFDLRVQDEYVSTVSRKLGLLDPCQTDPYLVSNLFETMRRSGADFHLTFEILKQLKIHSGTQCLDRMAHHIADEIVEICADIRAFRDMYRVRKSKSIRDVFDAYPNISDDLVVAERILEMCNDNICRLNERGIVSYAQNLTDSSKYQNDKKLWTKWIQKYISRIIREKETIPDSCNRRRSQMETHNPRFVPSVAVIREVINSTNQDDLTTASAAMLLLENPYSEPVIMDNKLAETVRFLQTIYHKGAPDSVTSTQAL